MKIAVAGTGYVGLVTGVCLAEHGHDVICVDVDEAKVKMMKNGHCPIYEDGLEELMAKNKERLTYTTDYRWAYQDADVIFIGVGTPEKSDGSANLQYIYQVAGQIADSVEKNCVVVIKSTVPIGTNDKIELWMNQRKRNNVNIWIASNPEFLAQGTAVRDTLHASRIVIGAENDYARNVLQEVYKDFDAPVLVTDRRSAEMIKYASNDFLALKISYINEIANLCEIVGANIEDVSKGMGYDSRIGNKFLNAGIGYGGSCFPKDTKALSWLASFKKSRKYYEDLNGLTITVLGLTFKPGTDDLREAPSLVNIPLMLEDGAKVQAWDPVGIPNFKKRFEGRVHYCSSIQEALKDADICFIFTEWKEVKELDPMQFKQLMKNPIVMDGRNCYPPEKMKQLGIVYESIGRPE